MTAQILAAELGTLISDSKRKNTELRTAAEKALQDLKSLSNTSEAQLSAGKQSSCEADTTGANRLKRPLKTTSVLLSILDCLQHSKCKIHIDCCLLLAAVECISIIAERTAVRGSRGS